MMFSTASRAFAPCVTGLLLVACAGRESAMSDGGGFTLPDSGYIYDGGDRSGDAGEMGAVPFECSTTCEPETVCGCLDARPKACGCNRPQGFAQPCDPLVPASCREPFSCVTVRKLEGQRFVCSDGREGAPCSHAEETCETSIGCVCQTSIFGTRCECQGATATSPVACDPLVPASCPDGTCVRVNAQQASFHLCSDGSEFQPCEPGDGSCRTSLGCTCALSGEREICRCAEPGLVAGEPCDPRVLGSCDAPLECQVRFDFERGGYVSECAPTDGSPTPGTSPYDCDPARPMCPPQYACEEVSPGRFRCVIDPL